MKNLKLPANLMGFVSVSIMNRIRSLQFNLGGETKPEPMKNVSTIYVGANSICIYHKDKDSLFMGKCIVFDEVL